MDNDELLIKELSHHTGVEMEYRTDERLCEISVDGHVLMLRYRPDGDDWLYFGVVADFEDEGLSEAVLTRALEFNLFGAGTSAFHLGLFGMSFILSGTVAMDGLTAESFADRLVALGRKIEELSGELAESGAAVRSGEGESSGAFGADLVQV